MSGVSCFPARRSLASAPPIAVLAALGWLWATASGAGPSLSRPEDAFEVRPGDKGSALYYETAAKLETEARQELETYEKIVAAGDFKKIKPADVGETHIKALNAHRAGNRLTMIGETAGVEQEKRAGEINRRLRALVKTCLADKATFGKFDFDNILRLAVEKSQKDFELFAKLRDSDKIPEADEQLRKIHDNLMPITLWSEQNLTQRMAPYRNALDSIQSRIVSAMQEEALAHLESLKEPQLPNFQALVGTLTSAAERLAQTPRFEHDGKMVDGPEFVAQLVPVCLETHLKGLRYRALAYSQWPLSAKRATTAKAMLDAEHPKFLTALAAGFAALIEAEEKRGVLGQDAARLYSRYLAQLAPLAALEVEGGLSAALKPALEKLAARSNQLREDVKAYADATGDLLRWRKRFADARRTVLSKGRASLNETLLAQAKHEPTSPGLFAPNQPGEAKLNAAARLILPVIGPKLQGKQVFVQNVLGPTREGGAPTSEVSVFCYAVLPGAGPPADLVERHRASLLVSGDAGPLTLDAAVSLELLRRGGFSHAGGELTEVELQGQLSRFATLSDQDWGLVRLRAPRQETITLPGNLPDLLLVRCTLKPAWVQHPHFIIELE